MCERMKKDCIKKIPCNCFYNSVNVAHILFFVCKTSQYICGYRCSWQGHNAGYFNPGLWTGKAYLEKGR